MQLRPRSSISWRSAAEAFLNRPWIGIAGITFRDACNADPRFDLRLKAGDHPATCHSSPVIMNPFSTSDLHDACMDRPEVHLQIARPGLKSFGGKHCYSGEITTAAAAGTSALRLRDILSETGLGRVLVVEGNGIDAQWALLGDRMGQLAFDNGWSGVVLHGYIRDVAALKNIALGVHALGSLPSRPRWPESIPVMRDIPLAFQGMRFLPGHWLYADEDGLITTDHPISL
jgi:regulator of ribonuclease activity A